MLLSVAILVPSGVIFTRRDAVTCVPSVYVNITLSRAWSPMVSELLPLTVTVVVINALEKSGESTLTDQHYCRHVIYVPLSGSYRCHKIVVVTACQVVGQDDI